MCSLLAKQQNTAQLTTDEPYWHVTQGACPSLPALTVPQLRAVLGHSFRLSPSMRSGREKPAPDGGRCLFSEWLRLGGITP